MTILNCSATTCMYNDNARCSRGNIEVNGAQARRSDETSCENFYERKNSSMQNNTSEHCGCEKIQVDCKAQGCTYNNSCKCTASSINITGNHASAKEETACSTFHCSSCN